MVLVVVLVANVVEESNWAVVCCLFLGYAMFVKKGSSLVASCQCQACTELGPGLKQSDDIHQVHLLVACMAPAEMIEAALEHQCCSASYCDV